MPAPPCDGRGRKFAEKEDKQFIISVQGWLRFLLQGKMKMKRHLRVFLESVSTVRTGCAAVGDKIFLGRGVGWS